jgi:two-component system response regulator
VAYPRQLLEGAETVNSIHTVSDGVEAMDFLHRDGEFRGVPRPDLILLNLNLPRMDGREVLAEIKGDVALKAIPVVILTWSSSQEDILRTYNLQASAYLTKPVDLDQFLRVVGSIGEYWTANVKLPPETVSG